MVAYKAYHQKWFNIYMFDPLSKPTSEKPQQQCMAVNGNLIISHCVCLFEVIILVAVRE